MANKNISIIAQRQIPYRNFLSGKIDELYKIKIKKKDKFLKPPGKWYGIKHYWIEFGWDYHIMDKKKRDKEKPNKKYEFDACCLYGVQFENNSLTDINNPDKNKIIVIKTIDDMVKFTEKYKLKKSSKINKLMDEFNYIDWYKVSKDYAGIEIPKLLQRAHTPMFFDKINNSKSQYLLAKNNKDLIDKKSNIKDGVFISKIGWYYGWDVPSGNIWNPKPIKCIYELTGF
jgi:hypothetical protein